MRRIAADHMLSRIDAELAWVERAMAQLRETGREGKSEDPTPPVSKRRRARRP